MVRTFLERKVTTPLSSSRTNQIIIMKIVLKFVILRHQIKNVIKYVSDKINAPSTPKTSGNAGGTIPNIS
jgi:hypothetical protein